MSKNPEKVSNRTPNGWWVVKYPAEEAFVKVGEEWYVLYEPIVANTSPVKVRVTEITKGTITLKRDGAFNGQISMHHAVKFLEKAL